MILDALFAKRQSLENPSTDLSNPDNWLYTAMGAIPSATGVRVTEQTATQITAFWSAVNILSDTIAYLPMRLRRKATDGTHEVIRSHVALSRLTIDPNPYMDAMVFRAALSASLLVWGNGYAWVRRNALGQPLELWPLLPNMTQPHKRNGELVYLSRFEGGSVELPARDVLHIVGPSRDGGYSGMSVLQEQREALGSAIASKQFGARFFRNGAVPGSVLSFPNTVKDPKKVRDMVEATYTGEGQHSVMVVDNGAKFERMGIPPRDAQWLEGQEFTVDEIGRMFRLPAHFLNKMGQATYNNLEQMGTHFVQHTLMPWLVRWEQQCTRKLLSERDRQSGTAFMFVVNGLMRGDAKSRAEFYAKAITNGWMTRNEVRALEDMNPLEGLDEPLTPANMNVGDEDEGDEGDDDEGEDDESTPPSDEGEGTDRGYRLALAAAQRCARREYNGLIGVVQRGGDVDEVRGKIRAFFEAHQRAVAENLALTDELARQYCEHREQELFSAFMDGNDCEALLQRWSEKDVHDIAEAVKHG